MRHQLDVVPVVAPTVGKIIRKTLTAREELLEVRKAARQWMSAGIDDSRVRQDQMNEPDVGPVVWQLVDEVGLCLSPLHSRARQILFPQVQAVLCRKQLQPRRIQLATLALPQTEPFCERQDVWQLHRPLNHRMAGQNLLDQS